MRRATKAPNGKSKPEVKRCGRSKSAVASPRKPAKRKEPAASKRSAAAHLPDNVEFHAGSAPARGRVVFAEALVSELGLKYAYILKVLGALQLVQPLSAEDEKRVEAALDEGLQNAIVWGNQNDPAKKLFLWAWVEDGGWGVTLSDQGKGFCADTLPDYASPEFPWQEKGRGILRLSSEVAEVHYYDGGRTLLVKG